MNLNNKVIVFDLDDTLFKEIDFLKSGFRMISSFLAEKDNENLFKKMLYWYKNGFDVFEKLTIKYNIAKEILVNIYRYHHPNIDIEPEILSLLYKIKQMAGIIGIITDGRSRTQRNKLKALKIEDLFDDIIISEEYGSDKLDERNFLFFHDKYPGKQYIYIGDNPDKDFIVPNKLNWMTYCLLDNGLNIHPQNFNIDKIMLPKKNIKVLNDLLEDEIFFSDKNG